MRNNNSNNSWSGFSVIINEVTLENLKEIVDYFRERYPDSKLELCVPEFIHRQIIDLLYNNDMNFLEGVDITTRKDVNAVESFMIVRGGVQRLLQ